MHYKVEILGDQKRKLGKILNFDNLETVFEVIFNDEDFDCIYNETVEEDGGYDKIKLPLVGFVDAATIAKNLYPEKFKAQYRIERNNFVSEVELYFKNLKEDDYLMLNDGKHLYYTYPSRHGGFRISEED